MTNTPMSPAPPLLYVPLIAAVTNSYAYNTGYHPNLNWSRVKLGGRQFKYSLNSRRRLFALDFSYRSSTASGRQMMCWPL